MLFSKLVLVVYVHFIMYKSQQLLLESRSNVLVHWFA